MQAGEGLSVEGPWVMIFPKEEMVDPCAMLFPEEEVVGFPPNKRRPHRIKGHVLAEEKTSKFSANLFFQTILFIV